MSLFDTLAVAVPEFIEVPKPAVFSVLDPRVIRRRFRSPQRTKRRWMRDHKRMVRDRERGAK